MVGTVYFKGSPVSIAGTQPPVGSKVKNFFLAAKNLQDKSLHDFPRGLKLVYTVPSLDTPVCSKSLVHFHEKIKDIKNLTFLLISADLPFAQQRVCLAERVENVETLSVMRNTEFAKDYGVLIDSSSLKGLLARAVFLIDEDNTLVYFELVSEITNEPNYDAVFNAIQTKIQG